MKWEKFRHDFSIFLFNVFTVISVFTILRPFGPETSETITVNSQKIYINLGWLWVYSLSLLLVVIINILFLERKRLFLIFLGILAGSFVLLNTYTFPALVQIVNSFNRQGLKAVQYYIPHVAAVLGSFLALGVLRLYNGVFK